jgi:hypothetical protein
MRGQPFPRRGEFWERISLKCMNNVGVLEFHATYVHGTMYYLNYLWMHFPIALRRIRSSYCLKINGIYVSYISLSSTDEVMLLIVKWYLSLAFLGLYNHCHGMSPRCHWLGKNREAYGDEECWHRRRWQCWAPDEGNNSPPNHLPLVKVIIGLSSEDEYYY